MTCFLLTRRDVASSHHASVLFQHHEDAIGLAESTMRRLGGSWTRVPLSGDPDTTCRLWRDTDATDHTLKLEPVAVHGREGITLWL